MKPGSSLQKLNSNRSESDETLGGVKKELQSRNNQNTMVSRGLLIQECPSKEMNQDSNGSDIEDVPYPEDDEEKNVSETSEDVALRDKLETED